jgi:hypothetical protein
LKGCSAESDLDLGLIERLAKGPKQSGGAQ